MPGKARPSGQCRNISMAIARTWIAGSREVESHAPQLNIAGYDVIFFIARVLPSRFWWASEPIVFYYIDVGYDPKWAKFSIGSVLQWEVMEDLYRKGNTPTIFDF